MSAKGNRRNDSNRSRYLAEQAKRIQEHPGTYTLGVSSTDGSSEPVFPAPTGECTGFPGVYYERQKK